MRLLQPSNALGGAILVCVLAAAPSANAQDLQVGAYGAIDYSVVKTIPANGAGATEDSFAIPTLDLFLRANIDKFSFLSEVLFDIPDGNTIDFDLDRFQMSYDHADWLVVTGGRFHSPFGYFNTAYPHGGAVFLLGIDRPALVAQHDIEAILPTEGVGIMAHGKLPFGHQAFEYDFAITNGRGRTADELTNSEDYNKAKAFNLRLRYDLYDFIFGANAYIDSIPPRADAPAQPETLREEIVGAHVAYVEHPWHFIAEGALVRHVGQTATYSTLAALGELGYTIKVVTPYVRFEGAKFPSAQDPFWAATIQQARGSYEAVSVGGRWQINENIVAKLELERNAAQVDTFYSATTQLAFGF